MYVTSDRSAIQVCEFDHSHCVFGFAFNSRLLPIKRCMGKCVKLSTGGAVGHLHGFIADPMNLEMLING